MNKLEESSIRVGEDTPYAATLTCIPFDDDDCLAGEWFGRVRFDNNLYNWPNELQKYDGSEITMWDDWQFPGYKSGGTYLMNLLENWHGEIVAMFERVKAGQS